MFLIGVGCVGLSILKLWSMSTEENEERVVVFVSYKLKLSDAAVSGSWRYLPWVSMPRWAALFAYQRQAVHVNPELSFCLAPPTPE